MAESLLEKPKGPKPCAVVKPNFFRGYSNGDSFEVELSEPSTSNRSSIEAPSTSSAAANPADFRFEDDPPLDRRIRIIIPARTTDNNSTSRRIKDYIRLTINQCISEEQLVSPPDDVLYVLKRKMDVKGHINAFYSRLRKMGYFWYLTKSYPIKRILLESSTLRLYRAIYLQKIKQYRAEKRDIIFLSKYFDYYTQRGNTTYKTFTLNVNSSTGLAPHSINLFEMEYSHEHSETDLFLTFNNWVCDKVLPFIPANAVIVFVNLPFQNILLNPPPEADATKIELCNWLDNNNVPFNSNMSKPELYKLIVECHERVKKFSVDELFKRGFKGHPVLRCPPQHYDLTMTHLFWSQAFYKLTPQPRVSRAAALHNLIQDHLSGMTVNKLTRMQSQLIENEKEYEKCDNSFDVLTDYYGLDCDHHDDRDDVENFNVDTRNLFFDAQ